LIAGIIYLLDVRLFGGNEDCFWREFFWEKAVVLFFFSVMGLASCLGVWWHSLFS